MSRTIKESSNCLLNLMAQNTKKSRFDMISKGTPKLKTDNKGNVFGGT
jgi:hypothetical protein